MAYSTIAEPFQYEIEPIKKSRFIASLHPLDKTHKLQAYLQQAQQQYPNANHHCWAYQILDNNLTRFSDDGEPSGSAGKPILNHIQGKALFNVVIIVSRIFGGTKLGVGGLVRAYGQAASEVIAHAQLIPLIVTKIFSINYQYHDTAMIQQALHTLKLTPIKEFFSDRVSAVFEVAVDQYKITCQTLTKLCHNRIDIVTIDNKPDNNAP
ncbi:IMPACT family protein [Fastidiosibacter lacustris]|uniref:IMPACT family protein n=1 Tax=Fastidiosibacter lacustris TaxID=2056695 RepID=UPI000E34C84D|nr:YigZ family protein [Fastidiosibacter lacustris]